MNRVSRSDTISSGKPCNRQISLTNSFASSWAVVFGMATKCAILENLSTITQMCSFPFVVFGSLTMKSIDIADHGRVGSSRGSSSPYLLCLRFLYLWQESHFLMSRSIFVRKSGMWKFQSSNSMVLSRPQCSFACSFSKISSHSVVGGLSRFFEKNKPSFSFNP